ncbi:YbbR family protein [Desulfarculus baarsii DSM 2075]|uniref:YbbR family protein n=1 Tax=Desulfarculus baarsii (strain ATCC 33931 / DSM 2075 / LMG 7858 / VKM B-1802 / 2st14) TaxID=644282 RepID=E1QF01_DESB2|nr:CdaR family protein [Desulfarculus baarsii]ADK84137.1 YbbR family protein [Desulfarculus baarsii DSM 2075]
MLERLRNNWQLKLLALFFSVMLWLIVVGVEKAEITVKVPVEVFGQSPNLVVDGEVAPELDLRLYGPRTLVRGVAERRPVKQVNLKGLAAGEHVFRLGVEDISLPPWVSVVRVSPSEIRLKLVERFSRQVRVSPVIKGQPADGFELEAVTFDPPMVTVSGLQKDLAELDWIWSEQISVSGLSQSTEKLVELRRPAGRSVLVSPTTVKAIISIKAASI